MSGVDARSRILPGSLDGFLASSRHSASDPISVIFAQASRILSPCGICRTVARICAAEHFALRIPEHERNQDHPNHDVSERAVEEPDVGRCMLRDEKVQAGHNGAQKAHPDPEACRVNSAIWQIMH
jgi:hypothetical protein